MDWSLTGQSPAAKPQAAPSDPLEDITALACAVCQAPVGLVCSRDQQGWRLAHNLGPQAEPLSFDLAFYTFAVTQRRGFEITDLRGDPAFSASPLVTGAPHFRFFAGAPVTAEDGQLLGAICVLDSKPRSLTSGQRAALEALARQIRAHIRSQSAASEREQIEWQAREQQRQWRRAFETASIGMAEIAADGAWRHVNGSLCAILGHSVTELMALRPRDVVFPDDLNSGMALLRKTLAGEIPSCSAEKRLLHKTGRIVWCSIHVTLVRDSDGMPEHFLAHVTDISELRKAQDGWRGAEMQVKALLELPVPVAILTTDEHGNVTFLNRHCEQLTGYASDELIGRRSVANLFLDAEIREHSQHLARFFGTVMSGAQVLLEHARSSGPEEKEWTWLRKDGSAFKAKVTVTAIRSANNGLTGFAFAATPCAAHQDAPPSSGDGSFRRIADSAPLGVFLTDALGNCTYVNEAFHTITGMAFAAANGEGWYSAIDSSDRRSFFEDFQKAMRRGSDFCREVRIARADGLQAWARIRGREIFFDDVAQGYVCTIEDVTHARRDNDSLRAAEDQLTSLFSNAPFPLLLLDKEAKITAASIGWLELHNRSWAEVKGQRLFDVVPGLKDGLEDLLRRAVSGSAPLSHEGTLRIREDAAAEVLRWQLFPLRVGGEVRAVALFEDRLTQHQRALAESEAARVAAESANRVKSEFLSEISAELRTPASGIIGLADLLLEEERDHRKRETIELIKSSMGSWLKLAGDLYDFSKMESRKVELEILPFNLLDGLNQTARRLAIAAEAKGLEFLCQTRPDLPAIVVGDSERLFQILSQLATFGIESSNHGEVFVSVDLAENSDPNPSLTGALDFHFVVRDSSGFPTDERLRDIQQVLVMVENTPALKGLASNLGLVLSARLVRLMGGRLWVQPHAQGCEFHFTAPLSGKRHAISDPTAYLADFPILIAEENAAQRKWLQTLLSHWRMKPTILEKPGSLVDVLEIAQEANRAFKFVLLDARISERDPFELAAQVKANPKTAAATPIMLLSAGRRAADETRARDAGLEHMLVKPIHPTELQHLLERLAGGAVTEEPEALPEATRRSFLPRLTLSILLVDDNRLNHEVAMGVFGPEGHRLAMARNGREAGAILERRACDIVLLNLHLPGENALETLAAIRRAEKEREKPVLVVGLTNDHSIAEREPTIKEITNGLLPTPIQPKDLSLLLDQFEAEWQLG